MTRLFWFSWLSLLPLPAAAQTFQGAISGTVVDATNALIAQVTIKAVHQENGFTFETASSESGVFLLPNVPPGPYTVTVEKTGFQTQRLESVDVAVARTTNVQAKLAVAEQSARIDVIESTTAVETTSSANVTVVGRREMQDIPINGRRYRNLIRLSSGVSASSGQPAVNGSRTSNNNYQIDGADNNETFGNSTAVGASAILPLDAVDQFSVVTNGSSDFGRNSGSTVSVVVKSGTNQPHGSAYFFNRNEYLAAFTPFQNPATAKKRMIRTNQWGAAAGAAIVKDRLFYFGSMEAYDTVTALSMPSTHPSTAWLNGARGVMARYGVPANPVSANLLTFWPSRLNHLPATANNYDVEERTESDTYSGLLKLDYALAPRHQLAARYIGSTALQKATGPGTGVTSVYKEFFGSIETRTHNIGVNLNSSFSHRLVNQLVLAANYYKFYVRDIDPGFDPIAAGLNTGISQQSALAGSPALRITNFAGVGNNGPTGRITTTGHITDSLSYTSGSHALKFGGEFRRARMDVFFYTNSRGQFVFDGTRGPWATDAGVSLPLRALSDYLAGWTTNNNGVSIVRGELQRDYYQNTGDWWVHDNWQATRKLNVNFGVRWSYVGPISDTRQSITSFSLERGFEIAGKGGIDLWRKNWTNFAPRFGFAYALGQRTVLRGNYGLFYDQPATNSIVGALNMPNGGSDGVHANPAGPDPVFAVALGGVNLVPGQPIFPTNVTPRSVGAFGVSPDYRLGYVQNYGLQIHHQLGARTVAQIGYVGSRGTALPLLRSVNPVVGGRRLHAAQYPQLAAINIFHSGGNSNYNSLQATLRATRWRRLTLSSSYTWSKSLDNGSASRAVLPANSFDLRREYGPSAFDSRHVFTGFALYDVPAWGSRYPRLTRGWQVTSIFLAHSGDPIDFLSGTNRSGRLDNRDRVDVVGDWRSGVAARANPFSPLPYFNPRAFAPAAAGTFGNIGRNSIYGPGFGAVDVSFVKETPITEKLRAQLRVEVYNISNRINWANPGTSLNAVNAFGLISNTRNGGGGTAGIGPGEPRNVQLALKLLW